MHPTIPYLREILVFLLAAGVLVPVVQRFRINPVLGFLLAGLLLGPFGLGALAASWPALDSLVLKDVEGARALAELGVVFLLFMIGLELSAERLWGMRRDVFVLGGLQVAASAAIIGGVAYAYQHSVTASLVIGLCLALSSTAIVMQLLAEQKRLATGTGRKTFAILLFQDLAVVPILFVVGFLGQAASEGGSGHVWSSLGQALGLACVTVAAVLLLGRLVLRPFLRLVGSVHSRELFLATILLVVIGISAATAKAGLSMALGAFLAGLLLAETEYKHKIEIDISPFKGLLLGFFFMSVCMGIDIGQIARLTGPVLLGVFGLYLVKGIVVFGIARASGLQTGKSIELGCLLGQGGEFAFVVLGLALSLALLPEPAAQYMLLVASLTMALTPLAAHAGRRLRLAIDGPDTQAGIEHATIPADLENHVVLVGYGRVGRALGAFLQGQSLPYLVIERSLDRLAHGTEGASGVLVGDTKDENVLKAAHLQRALAVVLTVADEHESSRILARIKTINPTLPVLARAHDIPHARDMMAHGADMVVPEIRECSYQLGAALLGRLGLPYETVADLIAQRRADDDAVLRQTPLAKEGIKKTA